MFENVLNFLETKNNIKDHEVNENKTLNRQHF